MYLKNTLVIILKIKKIGVITNINAKNRINENNNPYWFAFVSVQFLDTSYGREMYEIIVKKKKLRI